MPIPDPLQCHLIQPKFMPLRDGNWVAVAQVTTDQSLASNHTAHPKTAHPKTANHKISLATQRLAVRALCQRLLNHIERIDEVEESQFPYRLKHYGDYLCFSHSHDYVAVALNKRGPCGIDLELSAVSWPTAQRFYHPDELAILAALEPLFRQLLCRYLWQIKECLVKVEQGRLIPTLGRPLLPQLTELIEVLAPYHSPSPYSNSIAHDAAPAPKTLWLKLAQSVPLANGNYYIYLSPVLGVVALYSCDDE